MAIYRFGQNSAIDDVTVQRSGGGGTRAYIHAREGSDPAQMEMLKKKLTESSMYWTPITHEGKATIEVRHIGANGKKLLKFLAGEAMTTGTAAKEAGTDKKTTFGDWMRSNLLRLSGAFYSIGDVGFLYNGWQDAFKNTKIRNLGIKKFFSSDNLTDTGVQTLLGAIFYALGSPIMTFFGRGDKSDIQLRHMSYDALKFLENEGVPIPEDASIRSVTYKHNSNPWRMLKSKLERYPAEICNSLFAVAGAMLVWSGLKRRKIKDKSQGAAYFDIGLGISTIFAGLVSLVEEEPRQPGESRKSGLQGAWQFVKEKPLRMAAFLLGISTIGHGGSAISTYRKARNIPENTPTAKRLEIENDAKGSIGRFIFTGTNLAAEGVMSFASKGHGEGVESDPSLKPSTYAVMADLIERSLPEKRDHILDLISSYLSKAENLNLPQDEIKAGIETQRNDMQQNPWAGSIYTPAINKKVEETMPRSEREWRNLVTQINESAPTPAAAR